MLFFLHFGHTCLLLTQEIQIVTLLQAHPAPADLKMTVKMETCRGEREKSLLQAGQQQVQNEVDGGTLTCLLLCDSRLFLGLQFEEKENAQQACICGQNTLESVDNKIRKSFQRLVFNIVAHLSYLKFNA